MTDKLLTPEEVAERLSVAESTVLRWLRTGEMTGVKLAKVWRVRDVDLNSFIESKVRKGDDEA